MEFAVLVDARDAESGRRQAEDARIFPATPHSPIVYTLVDGGGGSDRSTTGCTPGIFHGRPIVSSVDRVGSTIRTITKAVIEEDGSCPRYRVRHPGCRIRRPHQRF